MQPPVDGPVDAERVLEGLWGLAASDRSKIGSATNSANGDRDEVAWRSASLFMGKSNKEEKKNSLLATNLVA